MKYIKSYNESLSNYEIESICKEYGIKYYTINGDGSIDVDSNVYLMSQSLTELPVKFNKVSGAFNISYNKLKSLEGCPKEVGGYFTCEENEIISLKGGPKKVGGDFDCIKNEIISLEGSPKIIGGALDCSRNYYLTSLRGLSEDFEGCLYAQNSPVFSVIMFLRDRYTEYGLKIGGLNTKIAHLLNEYDVISLDGKKIYRDNIEEVFDVLGLETPKDIEFKNYEIH